MKKAFQKSKGISEDGNKIDKLKNSPDHLLDITRQRNVPFEDFA